MFSTQLIHKNSLIAENESEMNVDNEYGKYEENDDNLANALQIFKSNNVSHEIHIFLKSSDLDTTNYASF